jgi:CxxC motif-containing protein
MLIETPYKTGDVVTLKILGGDEVVGRLVAIDGNVTINKPHAVMMGQQGFGLAPYVLTAGPDFKIDVKDQHIVCIVKTYDPVAKEYIKQTSGLMV